MQKKWSRWWIVGFIAALVFVALIVPLGSQVLTIWAYKVMGGVIKEVPSVDSLAQQVQNMLNLIDFVALAFTAMLAIAGVIGVRSFRDIENETQKRMKELDEKRQAIENLQKEVQGKIETIGNLEDMLTLQQSVNKSIEDTNKALLYLVLGNQLVELKKIAEAISSYEKVKALRPEDPQVNYVLGRTYRGISSYDQAIECLETSIKGDPDFASAHFELGLAYRSRADKLYADAQQEAQHDDEYDKAIEQMKLAVKLQPLDDEAIGTLGGTYKRMKDYRNALRYYKQAYSINNDSSYAIGNIACIAWHEGNRETSLDAFTKTQELAQKRIDARTSYEPYWDYFDRGMARLALGNQAEAFSDYHYAISLTRSPEHFKIVANTLHFLKEVEDKYPIEGLNEVLQLVEEVGAEAEARVIARHVA